MKNEIIKIADGVWQIRFYWFGMADVYMYLIEGEEKAMLIDTGYSNTHAADYVHSVTDKPVILVNTHGHFDHCGGNGDFEEAYMSSQDLNVYETMRAGTFTKKTLCHVAECAGLPMSEALQEAIDAAATILHAPVRPLPEEGYFDLGNRKIYFAETPGHTPGSIALGDEKTGILFSGDSACCQGVLLALDHSCSVSVFRDSIRTMKRFMKEHSLSSIYPSHHEANLSPKLLDEFDDLCSQVISSDIQGVFQDIGVCAGNVAQLGDAQIVYSENRI